MYILIAHRLKKKKKRIKKEKKSNITKWGKVGRSEFFLNALYMHVYMSRYMVLDKEQV